MFLEDTNYDPSCTGASDKSTSFPAGLEGNQIFPPLQGLAHIPRFFQLAWKGDMLANDLLCHLYIQVIYALYSAIYEILHKTTLQAERKNRLAPEFNLQINSLRAWKQIAKVNKTLLLTLLLLSLFQAV